MVRLVLQASGLPRLASVLDDVFHRHRDAIKARHGLAALEWVARSLERREDRDAFLGRVDRACQGAALRQLRLLELARRYRGVIPADLRDPVRHALAADPPDAARTDAALEPLIRWLRNHLEVL
ncbi:hypothetical protein GCM10009557_80090 [Virgisporangium ochraceum]